MARATHTTTTRRRHFPARIISRKRLAAASSTIRRSAVSSARSESGSNIGPSCAKSGAGLERQPRTAPARRRQAGSWAAAFFPSPHGQSTWWGGSASKTSRGGGQVRITRAPHPQPLPTASLRSAGGGERAHQSPKRRRPERRIRHARRPLSGSKIPDAELLPHPTRHPQRRGAGQRQAHPAEEPAGSRTDGAHAAAAARAAETTYGLQRRRSENHR